MSFVLDGGQRPRARRAGRASSATSRRSYKDLVGTGKSLVGFAAVPLERARDYAAEHADVALRLHTRLKPRLVARARCPPSTRRSSGRWWRSSPRWSAPASTSTAPSSPPCRAISPAASPRSSAIYRAVGHAFNIGSTKQLGEVLFDELGLPGGKKGKTGAYGTDAAILEELAPTHDLPARVLDWRQLTKLKAPMPTRSSTRSIPRPAASIPPSRWPRPRPAGSPRPIPICRTSRSAPRRAAASAAPSSPSPAIC